MSLSTLAAIPPYVFYELDARRQRQRATMSNVYNLEPPTKGKVRRLTLLHPHM